jgi:hypothetical protein
MKLKVHDLSGSENYSDIARIPRHLRQTQHGKTIESGKVCRLSCNDTGKEWFVIARGLTTTEPRIRIDYQVRQRLGVQAHETYDFELQEADFCGQVWWAIHATDTQYSFASKVSLIGAVLGVLGLVIAVIPLILHR